VIALIRCTFTLLFTHAALLPRDRFCALIVVVGSACRSFVARGLLFAFCRHCHVHVVVVVCHVFVRAFRRCRARRVRLTFLACVPDLPLLPFTLPICVVLRYGAFVTLRFTGTLPSRLFAACTVALVYSAAFDRLRCYPLPRYVYVYHASVTRTRYVVTPTLPHVTLHV